MLDPSLLDDVYEVAACPERLPELLHALGRRYDARGGLIFETRASGSVVAVSPGVEESTARYIAGGYMEGGERAASLIADHAPQFRTDSDFFTPEMQATMPAYRDLLIPNGFAISAGTVLQGTDDNLLVVTLDGFESEAAVRRHLPALDRLRPHIARAVSLAARMMLIRSAAAVQALDMIGTAAAIIGPDKRLRAMNASFGTRMGNRCFEQRGRLRFRSPVLDARIDEAIVVAQRGGQPSATLINPADDVDPAGALHIIPLHRTAADRFDTDGLLLILAEARNRATPQAGLLRLLFDLTPAEALLAAELAAGHTLRDAAVRRGITYSTARVHLRQVFMKTGCHRQCELTALLDIATLPGTLPT